MESAVKIILTNKENKVLLQLRDQDHSYTGYWALFGWHIDGEETPEEALLREIKEEINYDLKYFSFIKEYVIEEFWKIYLFHGTIDVSLDKLTLLEWDDFRFFDHEELSHLKLTPNVEKVLTEYFDAKENVK